MSRDQRVVRPPAATRRDRAVSVLAALLLAAMALAALLVGPSAEADQTRPELDATPTAVSAEAADANPGPMYPVAASATRFRGLGFDTCAAPSRRAMSAWRSSPYKAVGIYISGRNRACSQPELTAAWVRDVTAQGWKLLPINMGLQAPCRDNKRKLPIKATQAAAQGTTEAAKAVAAAAKLGILPGSPIYADIEAYNANRPKCVRAVAIYLDAWTRELHRLGYLAGMYSSLGSGLTDAARRYTSGTYARPDAVWSARWDRSPTLRGWAGVSDQHWAAAQRAKQYRGDHRETHGGVTLLIDSDVLDAPVATVARAYPVTSTAPLNVRRSPTPAAENVGAAEPGSQVTVVCQVTGAAVGSNRVWNKLADGSYVSDAYVAGGAPKPLPRCSYPAQVLAAGGAAVRGAPAAGAATDATLPLGALAWVTCTDGSGAYVQLPDGRYVAAADLARFTAALSTC
jgi:hypothetical protein